MFKLTMLVGLCPFLHVGAREIDCATESRDDDSAVAAYVVRREEKLVLRYY
jgi:hypothetical protein